MSDSVSYLSDSASYTAGLYPAVADLEALIASCQIIDTSGKAFGLITLRAKIDAAIAWWEKKTGWKPFLAADENGSPALDTRLFDIPRGTRTLELRTGLLSVASLTIFDTPYTENQDFFLEPANAPREGEPYTAIRFLGRFYSHLPNAISITGVWGYSLSCPGDAWEAILQKAALLCVPALALGISKGKYERRAGDEMDRFSGAGQSPLSAEAALWTIFTEETARAKKRITA